MALYVDLNRKNFFRTGNSQACHLATQVFSGAIYFLVNLSMGSFLDALTFNASLILGFFHDLIGALVSGINNASGLVFRIFEALNCLMLGQFQIVIGTIGGGQAIGNFFSALFHGGRDMGPHIFHAEHDKQNECHQLPEQRHIDIHASLLSGFLPIGL